MTEIVTVEILCPDTETATRIAGAALDRRLAACANIGAGVTSHYTWQGMRECASETPLFLKTRATLFRPLAALARHLHPYDLPCILAHPATMVTEDYRDWVLSETESGA
ncbi:divalent-cation tolerance protein CutA [Amaricoccus solimangrovi]|uniref:Divalent-cation tolerance protein CutA n=1 Tax=Amaricoccus solimangrovi TaxID=2589815 RepID=A0A501X0B0_9RHOB|nr:divalent-cation tolerance protein CutA [Amaricoccus solimangrovi]TPE52026.1 divalent-cation tolerance protein CutA [Amaricoccus solimangrovi]